VEERKREGKGRLGTRKGNVSITGLKRNVRRMSPGLRFLLLFPFLRLPSIYLFFEELIEQRSLFQATLKLCVPFEIM
jgi:hypothetical protein